MSLNLLSDAFATENAALRNASYIAYFRQMVLMPRIGVTMQNAAICIRSRSTFRTIHAQSTFISHAEKSLRVQCI